MIRKRKIPEEWYLIRRTSPTMTTEAEKVLKQVRCYFVDLDDYQEKHHTNPIVATEFNYKYAHTLLIHCNQMVMAQITATPHFQMVWSGPHAGRSCLTLTGRDADQIHLLLRIRDTQDIEVVRQSKLPQECQWKRQTILYGPLKNLEGQVVADRSNQRKFWFTTLPELRLLFLTPAQLLKKKKKEEDELLVADIKPRKAAWYVVYSKSIRNLEYAFLENKNDNLHLLQPDFFPSDDSNVCTIYHPEYVKRYQNGLDQRKAVLSNQYFIHTTRTHLETFRFRHPDSHVYVVRDRQYQPIQVKEKDLLEFIQKLDEINKVSSPVNIDLLAQLRIGDIIPFKITQDASPIKGKIRKIQRKSYIVETDRGSMNIPQENIQVDEELRETLATRKNKTY